MAGVKKRSGSQKGVSNNPKGRPEGSKNRVNNIAKEKIEAFVATNFEGMMEELKELEGRDRVKAYLELIRLVVPRAVNQEEIDAIAGSQSPLITRLFLKNGEE